MNHPVDKKAAPRPMDPESAFHTKTPHAHAPRLSLAENDPPGASEMGLSPAEVEQFRNEGYVIKRGLIPPEAFAPFLDLWWHQPPILAAALDPNDPATWVAPGRHWPEENRWGLRSDWMGKLPWPGPEDSRSGADIGERVGRLPHKLTRDLSNDVWRWHGIGHDLDFVAATSGHPNVLYMAEALLGGPIKKPYRNRGIYSIFPRDPDGPVSKLGPHMDANMTEMQVVIYLQDVEPASGGFTIFPTSPQRLYPTSEQALNWVGTPASKAAMDDIKQNVAPLEFVGKAGDVVFCHGLVVHSAGLHEGDHVRVAAIADVNRVRKRGPLRWMAAGKNGGPRVHCDMDGLFRFTDGSDDDPSDGEREVTNQWIMDCNEYALDRGPPNDDMFHDWNLGQRPVEGNVVDEPPWWEKYDLPLLPADDLPRGAGGTPAVALKDIATYLGGGIWRTDSRANLWMDA